MFEHGSRKNVNENSLEVSSRSRDFTIIDGIKVVWSKFSPFCSAPLTHPCDNSISVVSVEACWQGSKFAKRSRRKAIFSGEERWKKGTKPEKGIWINGKFTRNVGKGRRLVYIPVYTQFFWCVIRENYEWLNVLNAMKDSKTVYSLYDFDDNGDLDDPRPISHASILSNIINGLM